VDQLKLEIRSSKSENRIRNSNIEVREGSARIYDLEERTLQFARDVRAFVKALPRGIANDQDIKQLVRASGSIGANYIEANEALSRKDFTLHVKTSRKEAKEAIYWLRLLDTGARAPLDDKRRSLIQEATELMKIFGAMVRKSQ
jgi:four helix bundle protein